MCINAFICVEIFNYLENLVLGDRLKFLVEKKRTWVSPLFNAMIFFKVIYERDLELKKPIWQKIKINKYITDKTHVLFFMSFCCRKIKK